MSLLGNIGYLYMRILILLLIVGLGTAGYWAAMFLYEFFSLKKYYGFFGTDWMKVAVLSIVALVLIVILQQVLGLQSLSKFNYMPDPTIIPSYQTPYQSVPSTQTNPGQSHLQHQAMVKPT